MKFNIEFDEYNDLDIDGNGLAISSENILDGATTLLDAAEMARNFADYLEDLASEGYELTDVIAQGKSYANLDVIREDSLF